MKSGFSADEEHLPNKHPRDKIQAANRSWSHVHTLGTGLWERCHVLWCHHTSDYALRARTRVVESWLSGRNDRSSIMSSIYCNSPQRAHPLIRFKWAFLRLL
ncbi:hypothetical protein FVE85_2034 [Porphyridium purpureum]|uniref:Uncharacterized protein n=1 Tax=Porphyridium purpureum TaxID=35688 RepID=A0A5J4YWE3_PORPP|nr:hypothetical protein FVE85_2034 [Porphyridium purpureum]|eukprot:POR8603..scf209_3